MQEKQRMKRDEKNWKYDIILISILLLMKRNQLFSGATRPFPHTSFQKVCDSHVIGNFPSKQQRQDKPKIYSACNQNNCSDSKSPDSGSDIIAELYALRQEVNMLRDVVLNLKKEINILKSLNDKDATTSQLQTHEVHKELDHDVSVKMNEEIDINFDEYLSVLQRKKLLQSSTPSKKRYQPM